MIGRAARESVCVRLHLGWSDDERERESARMLLWEDEREREREVPRERKREKNVPTRFSNF